MADYYGVNATKAETGGRGDYIIGAGQQVGKVFAMVDSYEASAVAQTKTIQLGGQLPTGARILGVLISTDALGSSSEISIGDSASSDRYYAAYATTSATQKNAILVDAINYVIGTATGDNKILITVTGSGALTGTITGVVFYTVNQ